MPDSLLIPAIAKRRSLISRAIAFIAIVAVSLTSLVVWNSWQARQSELQQAEVTTTNMARALTQHAEASIGSTDNILAALVEKIEERGIRNIQPAVLKSFLMRRVAEQEIVGGLIVIDDTAHPLVNSHPNPPLGISYTDRDYFAHHRDYADRGPYVGPAVFSKTTQTWIITVSRRLENPDGTFAGVMLATIPLDFFRRFYEEFDIGQSGAIILAADDGVLLARHPFIASLVGTSISQGPVFNEYRSKGPVGTAMLVSAVDATERLYSYRHGATYPLLAAVAMSKADIYAEWTAETIRLTAVCIVLLIFLSGFGVYLVYQINLREGIELRLRDAQQALETLAAEDGLTGLANRRAFDAALKTEFDRAVRNRSTLALVMIDVDRFKQFNDLYGHPAGDECLVRIAKKIRSVPSRPADLCVRYGGEEMAILLPDTETEGARAIAEKVRAAVQMLDITHAANPERVVTVSLGVASIKPVISQKNFADLVKMADEALYNAKAAGRNQVIVAGSNNSAGTDK